VSTDGRSDIRRREIEGREPMNAEASQVVAAETIPRRDRLASLTEVRFEMARVYRQMRSGKVRTQDGTRLAYVLSMIGKLIEATDLQARLEALERQLGQQR
jgi:hypothetical protein